MSSRLFRIIRGRQKLDSRSKLVATLGMFDGVHLGHQALINAVVRYAAAGLDSKTSHIWRRAVITFSPHPEVALGRLEEILKLTSLRQSVRQLEDLGIDIMVILRFDISLRSMSAADFVNSVLIDELRVRHLVIGEDARVGKDRRGTPQVIAQLMAARGYSCEVLEFIGEEGSRISSGRIRTALELGDVELAQRCMGRPYAVEGRVIRGDGRGKGLGVPTANIYSPGQIFPKRGVYVSNVDLGGEVVRSVTNIGVRPTFGGDRVQVESHLIGYSGADFYGRRIEVSFLGRLRDERKFSGIEELKAQIESDIASARKF